MKIININHKSDLYDSALIIYNQVWPEYTESRAEWVHYDTNYDSKFYYQRFVVELDGVYAATGSIGEPWWSHKPGKLYFELSVLNKYRNKGVGSYCLEHVKNILSERNGYKLNVHSKEDYKDGIRFLESRRFKVVLREPGSKLKIKNFDFKKFKGFDEFIRSSGIEITSLSELQKIDKNWLRNLYELYAKIMKDIPNNDEMTERTFENFKKYKINAPGYNSDIFFIALNNDKYVGLSSLWIQSNKPKEYWTDLTGVVRSHRKRGIALALKVQTINYVKKAGGISIETDNEENNPMFNINKSLGFVPMPAWLTYEKRYNF